MLHSGLTLGRSSCIVHSARASFPHTDGSLGSRTALFHEPYADAPGTSGTRTIETPRLRELVVAADKAGLQASREKICL